MQILQHVTFYFLILCLCQGNVGNPWSRTKKNLCGTHDVSTCRLEMETSSHELIDQKSLPLWFIALELNSIDHLDFCSCAVQSFAGLLWKGRHNPLGLCSWDIDMFLIKTNDPGIQMKMRCNCSSQEVIPIPERWNRILKRFVPLKNINKFSSRHTLINSYHMQNNSIKNNAKGQSYARSLLV